MLLTPLALKKNLVQKEVENTLWICEFRNFNQALPGMQKNPINEESWNTTLKANLIRTGKECHLET